MSDTTPMLRTQLAEAGPHLCRRAAELEAALAQTMPALAAFQLWAGPDAAELVNGLAARHQQAKALPAELRLAAACLEQINARLAGRPQTPASLTRSLDRALTACEIAPAGPPLLALTFRPFRLTRTARDLGAMGGQLSDVGMPLWSQARDLYGFFEDGFGEWTGRLTGTVLFNALALLEHLAGLGEGLALFGLALHSLGQFLPRRDALRLEVWPLHVGPLRSRLHYEFRLERPQRTLLQTAFAGTGAADLRTGRN